MQKTQDTATTFEHAPVAELLAEHELIVRVLAAFETWAGTIVDAAKDDRLSLQRFLRFFSEYSDGCHHIKEERYLYACLNQQMKDEVEAPVRAMTGDHEESRKIVASLSLLAGQEEPWSDADRTSIQDFVASYVALYRQHIEMENKVLYPLADSNLPSKAWDEIEESFEGMQEEMECAGMVDELQALAEQLLN